MASGPTATAARKLRVAPDTKSVTTTLARRSKSRNRPRKREEPKRERSERAKTEVAPAKPQASGQMVCGAGGCRPVAKGCRLEDLPRHGIGSTSAREICN